MMVRDCDSLVGWFSGFKNNLAAGLVQLRILPFPAENFYEVRAGDVTRQFHATETISSRTRCRRICSGRGRSK